MYNIIFQLLYILQRTHHQMFSFHLSPQSSPLTHFALPPSPFPSGSGQSTQNPILFPSILWIRKRLRSSLPTVQVGKQGAE